MVDESDLDNLSKEEIKNLYLSLSEIFESYLDSLNNCVEELSTLIEKTVSYRNSLESFSINYPYFVNSYFLSRN